jgi:prepilin-type N-terminal cleavage/methylation domain-containing protein
MLKREHSQCKKGFTIAELLIAMSVLSVIATFNITKLLFSYEASVKKTTFRKVLAHMSELTYQGVLNNELSHANLYAYFFNNMNGVKGCNSNSGTQGCWTHTASDNGQVAEPGFILNNGAILTGLRNNVDVDGSVEHVLLDCNGADGPNAEGDDQIVLRIVFGSNTLSERPGTVVPRSTRAASVLLYKEIFSQ